jgi:hypothetical protein
MNITNNKWFFLKFLTDILAEQVFAGIHNVINLRENGSSWTLTAQM